MKKRKYKVGDKIVELGQVFKIFKIKKIIDTNGKLEKVIFFRPYYQTKQVASLVCYIPIKNVEKTKIRKPISQKEYRQLIKKLKKKIKVEEFPAINKAKELLKSNNPADTVEVIKTFCKEKEKSENFSKSKRDILNLAMENLVEEFALVGGVSLDKARERINLALQG
jgi:RNA polymerase-interacting CarD/CdnL/TRCF family regulator